MTKMSQRWCRVASWLAVCAMAWAFAATAVAHDTDYRATVPVTDTSTAQRDHAFSSALKKVLARAAGHSLDYGRIPAKAATYVEQYHYHHAPDENSGSMELEVQFAPDSIRHLVRLLGSAPPAAETSSQSPANVSTSPAAADIGTTLWVSNLHSARAFAAALATVRSVPGVDAVTIRQTRRDGMLLAVHTAAPLPTIVAALERSGSLEASGGEHAGATASVRWTR